MSRVQLLTKESAATNRFSSAIVSTSYLCCITIMQACSKRRSAWWYGPDEGDDERFFLSLSFDGESNAAQILSLSGVSRYDVTSEIYVTVANKTPVVN